MNSQEKALYRILYQNRVFKSDGQLFENLFTDIMTYSNSEFERIKAWGNIGDRKNDGYIKNEGTYFQVFAPEDIRKSYTDVVSKIQTDFNGLKKHWNPVNNFYFVVNDKFNGVNADSEKTLTEIREKHSLLDSGFLTASDLERMLFEQDDDIIQTVIGFIPNIDLGQLDYSALNQVVGHIMRLPLVPLTGDIKFPDWDQKIKFNGLSDVPRFHLNHGSQQLGALSTYLNQNTTVAEELQKQLSALYDKIKNDWSEYNSSGDNIFWELINVCSPRNEQAYQNAVIIILAKYFESCDIFEEPVKR